VQQLLLASLEERILRREKDGLMGRAIALLVALLQFNGRFDAVPIDDL
jgi:hypothetical protein